MGDISAIVKAIAEYGVLLVIAAIFLYAAIRALNILFDRLSKSSKNSKGSKKAKEDHDKLIDMRSEVSRSIQSLITEFLNDHDIDRIHIIEFSNTVSSVAYLPFKYMNCTYEVYKLGKHSTAKHIDHIPTSLFVNFFTAMHDNGYVQLDTKHPDHRLGGTVYDLLQSEGAEYMLCMMMCTPAGKCVGYVACERSNSFSSIDIEDLAGLRDSIRSLLCVADK